MAGAPVFKVYDAQKKYQAAVKEVEAAALLMNLYGDGATIRYGHGKVVWTEGAEEQPAGESYDFVGDTIVKRLGPIAARLGYKSAEEVG